ASPEGALVHRFALAARWSEWPLVARRALVAAVVLALIVTGIATDVLRRTSDLYVVVAAILVLLLALSAHAGCWLGLECAGVEEARGRWRRRAPLLQRAVPPLVIGVVGLPSVSAAGVA